MSVRAIALAQFTVQQRAVAAEAGMTDDERMILTQGQMARASLAIANTGRRPGAGVAQLYLTGRPNVPMNSRWAFYAERPGQRLSVRLPARTWKD